MKKDLILITAYCNTTQKKETLYNFLKSIQKYRDKYDVLLASHLPIDVIYYDYFDFCYYDSDNKLLTDFDFLHTSWYRNNDKTIWSQLVRPVNTLNSIWSLISGAMGIAKNLGYEKIHNFEYDTLIYNSYEIDENSKLLDEYDYVIYEVDSELHKMLGGFQSFTVNGAIDEWKLNSYTNMIKLFKGNYPKVPEKIAYDIITNNKKVYKKHESILKKNGIDTSKIIGVEYVWNVPFFEDGKLKFITHNPTNKIYNIKVIVNNKLCDIGDVLPKHWRMETLLDNFYEVKSVLVLKNDEKVLDIKFKNDYDRETFKEFNKVLPTNLK